MNRSLLCAFFPASLLAGAAMAQQVGAPGYSFQQAQERLLDVSDALAGADANVRASEATADARKRLGWPEVNIDVQGLRYRKTIDAATGALGAATGLPPRLELEVGGWRFRPILNAQMPVYAGGAIDAAQRAAKGGIAQARAEQDVTQQSLIVQLVQGYFGVELAQRVVAVRESALADLDHHLRDTVALERQGMGTKAQRLQAQVARDNAERQLIASRSDLETAATALAQLLHADAPVRVSTPLFVLSRPLDTRETFVADAVRTHPQVRRLEAMIDQASANVDVKRAAQRPQVYLFGQYNLNRDHALVTDPDYAFGAGLKFNFLTNTNRSSEVKAARAGHAQVEALLRQAQRDLTVGVTRAWLTLDSARRQYLLLQSSIAQAEENLRLQTLGFREGQGTSLDVIDARVQLSGEEVQRAQQAYAYDVALAQLLDASGRADEFQIFLQRADIRIGQ